MAQPSARWLGGWPTWVAACTLLLLAAAPWATTALQDGQALTPPMGYNTWNAYGADINESLICATAERLRALGLVDAGYRYLVLDDGWSDVERDGQGQLQADPARFPGGMAVVAACVQRQGLQLGLYADSGSLTCQGFPGSRGHERQDAQTFARWGARLLKYDTCYAMDDVLERFAAMRDALNATNTPILYMLCEWGIADPWLWGPQVAHSWRTTFDIHGWWESVMQNLDESVGLARFAGPGAWNDLDMLEIGGPGPMASSFPKQPAGSGWGDDTCAQQQRPNRFLSDEEERAHFALWAILKSPLFIAADLSRPAPIGPASLATLSAKEVIAVNQDPLGVPGDLIWKQVEAGSRSWAEGGDFTRMRLGVGQLFACNVYAAPLADGGRAVVLHNRHSLLSQYQATNITVRWEELGYAADEPAAVRDLYAERDLGTLSGSFTAEVRLHDAVALHLTPAHPKPSHADWRPWHGQPLFKRHEEDEGWWEERLQALA